MQSMQHNKVGHHLRVCGRQDAGRARPGAGRHQGQVRDPQVAVRQHRQLPVLLRGQVEGVQRHPRALRPGHLRQAGGGRRGQADGAARGAPLHPGQREHVPQQDPGGRQLRGRGRGPLREHSVHKLADHEVQTPATRRQNWLESGVQVRGSTTSNYSGMS